MCKRAPLILAALLLFVCALAQEKPASGLLTGNVMDEKTKPIEGATVQLISFADTLNKKSVSTDKTGQFTFQDIGFGYYKLSISYVGLQPLTIDSIHFRMERFAFTRSVTALMARSATNV